LWCAPRRARPGEPPPRQPVAGPDETPCEAGPGWNRHPWQVTWGYRTMGCRRRVHTAGNSGAADTPRFAGRSNRSRGKRSPRSCFAEGARRNSTRSTVRVSRPTSYGSAARRGDGLRWRGLVRLAIHEPGLSRRPGPALFRAPRRLRASADRRRPPQPENGSAHSAISNMRFQIKRSNWRSQIRRDEWAR